MFMYDICLKTEVNLILITPKGFIKKDKADIVLFDYILGIFFSNFVTLYKKSFLKSPNISICDILASISLTGTNICINQYCKTMR